MRSNYTQPLKTPISNRWAFYLVYMIYRLNELSLNSKKLEYLLWQLIKCELFYISGQCQHSGNCCKSIQLFKNGRPIETPMQFHTLCKDEKEYTRFTPNIEAQQIHSFTCRHLNTNNRCDDYINRPKICHNYPYSSFITHDRLYSGCGYKVTRKPFNPAIKSPTLNQRIQNCLG